MDSTPFKIKPSARYPNSKLRVPTSFAAKNRIDRKRKIPIIILKDSDDVYVFKFDEDGSKTYAIYKSSCRLITKKEVNEETELYIGD